MVTVIREQDLGALVVGVTLLGSGGGGDTGAFGRMLRRRLGAGELVLRDASDVPGAYLSPIGVVGATSVLAEKLPSGGEFAAAVQAVSRWTGQAVTGLMSLEAGSLTRALALGRAHAGLEVGAAPETVAAALGGRLLGGGRVEEVARHAVPGGGAAFGCGSVCVVDSASRAVLRIETENEYLLAMVNGEPVVSTPDLVCVLDRRTLQPIAVEVIRTGDEVLVLALPGPEWWRRDDRIEYVGPRAFGLTCEPHLLEAS